MRRLPGQVALSLGKVTHRLAAICLTLVILLGIVVAGFGWRLSQGPIDVTWLAGRIESMVNDENGPTRLTVGGAALAWDGFRDGFGSPLDLVLTGIAVSDRDGRRQMEIPRAAVTLSVRALLNGELLPRSLDVSGARLTVVRNANGTISLDVGSLQEATEGSDPTESNRPTLAGLLEELARPATNDRGTTRGILSQLRRVSVLDAEVTIIDRGLDITWRAPTATIVLNRGASGGVDGHGRLQLAMGPETATLILSANLAPGGEKASLTARLSPVTPAALARVAPGLDALSALDAAVTLEVVLDLGRSLAPNRGRLSARIGQGRVKIGEGMVPVLGGELVLSAAGQSATIEVGRLELRGGPGSPATVLEVTGTATRADQRVTASLAASFDQVAFADLPALWPPGAGEGVRPWMLENMPSGMARDAHLDLGLVFDEAMNRTTVTRAEGALRGEDLTMYWLRPVPPMDRGEAQLRILDPDTLEIMIPSARQHAGAKGGFLAVRNGKVRITGLAQRDQDISIQAEITGAVANVIALLKEPRLNILAKQPVDFRDPAGDASISLSLGFPLVNDLQQEQVVTRATARLTQVHLSGFVAGRDIDQGAFDMTVTGDGLTIKGKTLVAGIAMQVDGTLDFRDGPPNQVVQRVVATGRPGAGQLAAAGIDLQDVVLGEVAGTATYVERRSGDAEIAIDADLTKATLAASPIGWRKSPGVPAKGTGRVVLGKGRVKAFDRIAIDGEGVSVRGTMEFADGRMSAIHLERAVLGRTEARGTIRLPASEPIVMHLSGPSLDLVPKLTSKSLPHDRNAPDPPPGPAWSLDARFDQVLLAGGKVANGVVGRAQHDGRIYRSAAVSGSTGAGLPFNFDIGSTGGRRRVSAMATDAGTLLRGLDAIKTMEAGRLTLNGTFDDTRPGHPLSGSAEIQDFRVRGSVGLGKLLQAMTLYGLVDVLRGPGIGFTRLVAPFELHDNTLQLNDARAFSPSLGLTGKGRFEFDAEHMDMEGTIVPAYFFNSLLGHIPLVGKLFSPETGGGVFAARYSVRGRIEDPDVFVNPLSALTPGFLREIFGIF
ncbi:MAG: AsmA-like C-terminal region-containing protein [Acetobacteraceae bacterium]